MKRLCHVSDMFQERNGSRFSSFAGSFQSMTDSGAKLDLKSHQSAQPANKPPTAAPGALIVLQRVS